MSGCSLTMARFAADWQQHADDPLAAPLQVTAQQALDRTRRDGDEFLRCLINATQGGDDVAGRCVVQAMIGRLCTMATRDDRLDLDALVGALWLRILAYPLARRPRAIATNLVLDARKDTLREVRPLALVAAVEPRRHEVAARVIADGVRIGVIDPGVGAVMTSVYVLGLSGEAAAQRHGVTATTVRWRCSAGTRRLAQARELLA